MDGVLKVNLVNFITIGLMAWLFVFVVNKGMALAMPKK